MAFAENLDVFLSLDWGVPVTFASAPANTLGILGRHDITVLGKDGRAEVIGDVFGLRLKTTVAALLAPGTAITVNGTNYIARKPLAVDDGAFSIVELRNAT